MIQLVVGYFEVFHSLILNGFTEERVVITLRNENKVIVEGSLKCLSQS